MELISVGDRPPAWVQTGFKHYSDRLPRQWQFGLTEIPLGRNTRSCSAKQRLRDQGDRVLSAIPAAAHAVALAVDGHAWSSEKLSQRLAAWLQQGRDITLVVGGPDGLDTRVMQRCETQWSLSPLTFPHALVRVLVAEQLYRAWSLLNNHPYHRA